MSFLKNIGIKPVQGGVVKPAQPAIKPNIGIKGIQPIKPVIKTNIKEETEKEEIAIIEEAKEEVKETKEKFISLLPKKASETKLPKIKLEEEVEETKEEVESVNQKTEETEEIETKIEETKDNAIEEIVDDNKNNTEEEIKEEALIDNDEEPANNEISTIVEEVKEETKTEEVVEEEEKIYGIYTKEEWESFSPQKKAAITRKERNKAKSNEDTNVNTKESNSNKKVSSQEVEITLLPERSKVEYEELIANLVISSLGEEWDKMVEEVRCKLKSIQITPDMNTATMKEASADLATLRDELFYDASQARTIFEGVVAKIDVVKGLNTKGSSPDERKLNGLKACVHYTENGYTVNLYELLEAARVKHNFYTDVMKQIDYKRGALITMNGALKIEKDTLGI